MRATVSTVSVRIQLCSMENSAPIAAWQRLLGAIVDQIQDLFMRILDRVPSRAPRQLRGCSETR